MINVRSPQDILAQAELQIMCEFSLIQARLSIEEVNGKYRIVNKAPSTRSAEQIERLGLGWEERFELALRQQEEAV